MIFHIFSIQVDAHSRESSILKWKKIKKKKNFAFDVPSNRCPFYDDFSLEIFLRFSMPRRVVTIQKKFRIIKQFRSYQTLDEIYLRFEESLHGKRKKKKKSEERRRYGRKASIIIDSFYFTDCRHLRVHSRVCFQTVTTIIDGEWWTMNNHTIAIVSARGGGETRTVGKFATIQRLEHTSSDRLSPSYASLDFVIEDVI